MNIKYIMVGVTINNNANQLCDTPIELEKNGSA